MGHPHIQVFKHAMQWTIWLISDCLLLIHLFFCFCTLMILPVFVITGLRKKRDLVRCWSVWHRFSQTTILRIFWRSGCETMCVSVRMIINCMAAMHIYIATAVKTPSSPLLCQKLTYDLDFELHNFIQQKVFFRGRPYSPAWQTYMHSQQHFWVRWFFYMFQSSWCFWNFSRVHSLRKKTQWSHSAFLRIHRKLSRPELVGETVIVNRSSLSAQYWQGHSSWERFATVSMLMASFLCCFVV